MSIPQSLSTLALRKLVEGACAAVGVGQSGEAVVGFLAERFADHSQRLTKALRDANENAWRALEIALAGESFWERCKVAVARGEEKAFAQQVRAFLDSAPMPDVAKADFRQKCLEELRAARKGQALTGGTLDPRKLAEGAADFARFSDPASLLEAEWRSVLALAGQVKEAGFPRLAWLLSQRPQGTPVLVAGVRYFFRRAVEDDPKLAQGLAFAKMEALAEAQERGFAALSTALVSQGQRLEELLGGVQAVVVETHSAVLDLQGQMKGQGEQIGQIGQAVLKLLEQHQMQRREVRPGDSLSIRDDGERRLVKELVARYRALPEGERRNAPALLNAVGKLEVVSGDFDAAQKDFRAVADMVDDARAKAEAHFNAYQTALERRDFDAAMKEFIEAVKLDAKRYAPFPVGKYHPLRILGAGGFGTAFLCRHKYMNAEVVVKTLDLDALGRETDKVFTEAQVLRQLDHPAIIRISECGYVDATAKSRPHIIMDYFEGGTLEQYVKAHGPLAVEDLLQVARQVAEGLQAAHGAKILHRDVKPANLLVRKEAVGWKVKIIDFGLALPQKVAETSQNAGTARQKDTLIGSSIAGTADYGAPEQMGRRKEPVGPYSDVYGWAKTCCYALFQTTQPLMKHWKSVPEGLAELLEKCLDEDPKQRPQQFSEVIAVLDAMRAAPSREGAPARPAREQTFAFKEKPEKRPKQSNERTQRGPGSRLPLLIGGAIALIATVLMAGVVLRVKTKAGTLVVQIDQPGAEVYVDGKQYTISSPGDKETIQIEVQEGARQLKVVKGGFTTFTKGFVVESGGKETIRVRLEPLAVAVTGKPLTPGGTKEISNSIGMKLNLLPAGTFTMGSPKNEKDRAATEAQHEVEITKAFYMGVYEVTQQEYQKLMGANPSSFSAAGNESGSVKGMDTRKFPAENVSWKDAVAFCKKLSEMPEEKRENRVYRLPTEAEWEYACRGGVSTYKEFHFGDELTAGCANFNRKLNRTCEVGSYRANTFGLYDMHGNVWEWCADWYDPFYYAKSPRKDPPGPTTGTVRAMRGGSWGDSGRDCRTARRGNNVPDLRYHNAGFRVVIPARGAP